MPDFLFSVAFVCLGLIMQIAALLFRNRRAGPFLLLAGGALIAGFALWEHDAVLLGGQVFITAALWLLMRFRKT